MLFVKFGNNFKLSPESLDCPGSEPSGYAAFLDGDPGDTK